MRKQCIERHSVLEEGTERRQIIRVKCRYRWPWFEKIKQTIFIKSTVRPSPTFVRFDLSRLISIYPRRKCSSNTRHSKIFKIPNVRCFLQYVYLISFVSYKRAFVIHVGIVSLSHRVYHYYSFILLLAVSCANDLVFRSSRRLIRLNDD